VFPHGSIVATLTTCIDGSATLTFNGKENTEIKNKNRRLIILSEFMYLNLKKTHIKKFTIYYEQP
jgi:hypothetical protein